MKSRGEIPPAVHLESGCLHLGPIMDFQFPPLHQHHIGLCCVRRAQDEKSRACKNFAQSQKCSKVVS